MSKFKVGDWVEQDSHSAFGSFTRGKRYKIKRIGQKGDLGFSSALWCVDDNGKEGYIHTVKPASFRVGDRVEFCNMLEIKILKMREEDFDCQYQDEDIKNGVTYTYPISHLDRCKLITEDKMDKYTELKNRIERVEAWDKEADDILQEINPSDFFSISIPIKDKDTSISIRGSNGLIIVIFDYNSQCEKLEAFKKALMWLLDHSDIRKKDNTALQEQLSKLEKQIQEIKEKL
jgi:hypothetical protein